MASVTAFENKREFNCTYLDEISIQGLFLHSKIPVFQKSVASNFATIRKIFSNIIVQPKVSNTDINFLIENGLNPLQDTDGEKMIEELEALIEMENSNRENLVELAQEIFKIRVKELKYLLWSVSEMKLYEFKNGYKVLEKYLEFASK